MAVSTFDQEMFSLFIENSREYLDKIPNSLIALEANPDSREQLNDIFRSFHSIKGAAGIMEFNLFKDILHHFETLLDQLRGKKVSFSKEIAEFLFKGHEILEAVLNFIKDKKRDINTDEFKELCNTSKEEIESQSKSFLTNKNNTESKPDKKEIKQTVSDKTNSTPIKKYSINIFQSNDEPMKKVRLFLVYKALSDSTEILSSEPELSTLMDEDTDDNLCQNAVIIINADIQLAVIEEILSSNVSGSFSINELAEVSPTPEPIVAEPVPKQEPTKEIVSEPVKVENTSPTPTPERSQRKESIPPQEREEQNKNVLQNKVKEYIKVEKDKLDLLFNIVGELFIKKSNYNQMYSKLEDIQLKQISQGFNDPEVSNFIDYLGMLNKSHDRQLNDLQSISNSLRMVQLKDSFSRFSMAVRKLKSDLHKEIELEIVGEDTEVDKIIAEKLADPLLHMIRNSVDHGIETEEERLKSGKNPIGKILLKAYNSGNNVVIKVQDDGRGIDAEKLARAAVKKGIKKESEVNIMSYEEKLKLIFLPGFSTAEQVTDISGRGVGMDVVKQNIDSIKGIISIETKLGQGTSFIIKLPLTLAIIRALLFQVDDNVYAFPSDLVVTVEKVEKSKIEYINAREVFKFRNKVVPIINLKALFHSEENYADSEEIKVVVVTHGTDLYAFNVDKFLSQQHIVIKDIEGHYHRGREVLGAAILGDGRLSMVLDINTLVGNYNKL